MGRAPKPPGERKSAERQVTARLDEDERSKLEKLAVELRVTNGEVMRQALRELYDRVFPVRAKRGEK